MLKRQTDFEKVYDYPALQYYDNNLYRTTCSHRTYYTWEDKYI